MVYLWPDSKIATLTKLTYIKRSAKEKRELRGASGARCKGYCANERKMGRIRTDGPVDCDEVSKFTYRPMFIAVHRPVFSSGPQQAA